MENIRIKKQDRSSYVNGRRYEYFDVIADSERFGKNEIMCQGTFSDCLRYLNENNIDYFEECWKRNRNRDIQVSIRMYRITGRVENGVGLLDREGFKKLLNVSNLEPIAPETFRLSPGLCGEKSVTVKMMDARAW
ncbi:MAG: hypothetical protein J6V08_02755 [Candidatus Methanomethylophilaceae archaeon]|nr:hypothetical protein [Candidatus Methanomethylophilaceae archaeon]